MFFYNLSWNNSNANLAIFKHSCILNALKTFLLSNVLSFVSILISINSQLTLNSNLENLIWKKSNFQKIVQYSSHNWLLSDKMSTNDTWKLYQMETNQYNRLDILQKVSFDLFITLETLFTWWNMIHECFVVNLFNKSHSSRMVFML